jgi:hypothetical protein
MCKTIEETDLRTGPSRFDFNTDRSLLYIEAPGKNSTLAMWSPGRRAAGPTGFRRAPMAGSAGERAGRG